MVAPVQHQWCRNQPPSQKKCWGGKYVHIVYCQHGAPLPTNTQSWTSSYATAILEYWVTERGEDVGRKYSPLSGFNSRVGLMKLFSSVREEQYHVSCLRCVYTASCYWCKNSSTGPLVHVHGKNHFKTFLSKFVAWIISLVTYTQLWCHIRNKRYADLWRILIPFLNAVIPSLELKSKIFKIISNLVMVIRKYPGPATIGISVCEGWNFQLVYQ